MDRYSFETKFVVDDAGTVEAVAWPFGSPDRVGDIITKGAFSTDRAKIPMLWSHDQRDVIGVWDQMDERDDGLHVKGRLLLDTVSTAREVHSMLKAGAVSGVSIGFTTKKFARRKDGGRNIHALTLHEISIVAVPAHPGARVRSVKGARETEMENDAAVAGTESAADVAAIVTKALEPVTAEVKALGNLTDRLDKIEAKVNRPNVIVPKDEGIEKKAFETFIRKGREALTADEVKTLRVSDDTAGGYVASQDFVASIDKNVVQFSPVRQAARVGSTSSGEVIIPRRTGRPTASWVGETQTRTETESAYGQAEIPINEIARYVDCSNKLLEDAAVDVGAEVAFDLAEEFGRAEGAAFVSGDGTKKPLGFMSDTNLSYTPGGDASLIKPDGLIDLFYALAPFYRQRAVWMCNGSTLALNKVYVFPGNRRNTNASAMLRDNPGGHHAFLVGRTP